MRTRSPMMNCIYSAAYRRNIGYALRLATKGNKECFVFLEVALQYLEKIEV